MLQLRTWYVCTLLINSGTQNMQSHHMPTFLCQNCAFLFEALYHKYIKLTVTRTLTAAGAKRSNVGLSSAEANNSSLVKSDRLAAGFALSACTQTYTHTHSCFLLGTHITTMSLFLSG